MKNPKGQGSENNLPSRALEKHKGDSRARQSFQFNRGAMTDLLSLGLNVSVRTQGGSAASSKPLKLARRTLHRNSPSSLTNRRGNTKRKMGKIFFTERVQKIYLF